MNILSSLKEEKRLSFGHWRYRLLHWAFRVEGADEHAPEKTGLPRFLYTHYCPLFHLTNLIALLLPAILVVRVAVVAVKAGIGACSLLAPAFAWLGGLRDLFRKTENVSTAATSSSKDENAALLRWIREWKGGDFSTFWANYGASFHIHTQEEVQVLFGKHMAALDLARTRRKLRQDALRQRLAFWASFSQAFVRWGINIGYGVLALTLAWLAYQGSGMAWSLLSSCAQGTWYVLGLLFSLGSLIFVGKVVVLTTLVGAVAYGGLRFKLVQRFCELGGAGLVAISPPFFVLGKFGRWLVGSARGVGEFITMFYEESCPPITLISQEQAILEEEDI